MQNIGNLTVRAAILLKIKPSTKNGSVEVEERDLALLDEELAEKRARIAHIGEAGDILYVPDEEDQFTVELADPEQESQVKAILSHRGFQIAARYDAGWQTAEEMEAEAAVDRQLGIIQA